MKILAVMGAVIVILIGAYVAFCGFPLMEAPSADKFSKVTFTYFEESRTRELTEKDDIKTAVRMINALNYAPFQKAKEDDMPRIQAVYQFQDGSQIELIVGEHTVWWNQKAYPLKQESEFVNVIVDVFFHNN